MRKWVTVRKYKILSNLERIGKDWRSCRPEIGELRLISGKSFPIWRKLERIGRMERRGFCLVLWSCGSPIGQAQTVFGHAVGEVLQVGLQGAHHLLHRRGVLRRQVVR